MARPKIDIDPDQVFKLARIGASNVDIADVIECDESVIRRRFPEILAKGRAERRNTLREWQWDAASKGNISMLIWLGKNELGQSDKTEHSIRPEDLAKMSEEQLRAIVAGKGGGRT